MQIDGRHRYLISLLLMAASGAASAAPRLIAAADPAGEEIRAAGQIFFTKLDAGDADGAKALFDGPADEWLVAESLLRESRAGEALTKTVIDRFGETVTSRKMRVLCFAGTRAAATPQRFILCNGDAACIAREAIFDTGVLLHRVDGRWKVLRLVVARADGSAYCRLLDKLTAALADCDRRLRAGEFKTMEDFDARWGDAFPSIMDEWLSLRRDSAPATQPTASPGPSTAPSVPTLAAMRAALGKNAVSSEAQGLIAMLPGLPSLWESGQALDVRSEEGGIVLQFTAPGFELHRIRLDVIPPLGMSAFPSDLPEHLHRGDCRRDVERKLGPPLLSNIDSSGYAATYQSMTVSVGYLRPDARDADNPIANVSLISVVPEFEAQARKLGAAGPTHLQFRLVAPAFEPPGQETEPFVDPDASDGTKLMRVYREVVLDETAVARVSTFIEDHKTGHFAISLSLTLEGGVRLNQFTSRHVNERMAIILGDQAVIAPNIKTPMGADIVITMGAKGDNPGAFLLAGRLHAVVNALPPATTRPARK